MAFKFFTGIEKELTFYINPVEPFIPMINPDSYSGGWEAARHGYPESSNPWFPNTNEYAMWYCGWNDFINNH
jgi:hypothetical protein